MPADAWGRLIFTSGTTGKPKAIVHTHGGRWTAHLLQRAVLPFTPGRGDRVLLMTPYVHGASLLAAAWLEQGAEVVLQDGVRAEAIEPILAAGPSAIFAPPTVLAKILSLFPGRRFDGVRCIFTGTSTLSRGLWQRAAEAFGPVVRITYGMSECFNPITVLEAPEVAEMMAAPDQGLGACLGWPAPGVEVTIRDEEGAPLPAAGTWRDLAARPAHECRHDQRRRLRRAAAGRLAPHRGPRRDRCARSPAPVGPRGGCDEVRRLPHPSRRDRDGAGRRGRAAGDLRARPASDYWGEMIVAVAENPPPGWQEEATARVAALARHKHPRAWLTLPELPRNAQGKVVRARVREAILANHGLEDGPRPKLVAADAAIAAPPAQTGLQRRNPSLPGSVQRRIIAARYLAGNY